jgi:zinc transporter ZupT
LILASLFITASVRWACFSLLRVTVARSLAAAIRVLLLVPAGFNFLATIGTVGVRLLCLLVAVFVAAILGRSLRVRAIIVAAAAGFLVRLVLIERTTKNTSSGAQKATKTALLLLLVLT